MAFRDSFYRVVTGTRRALPLLAVLGLALSSGCGSKSPALPPGTFDPDKVLFERGTTNLDNRKWLTAREYFRQIVDGYPQSIYRADAKLGLGDTYMGENTSASFVLAINEFKEFLTFYPTNPRADYAQYKLALCHFYQMAKPERDQTETRETIQEFTVFFDRFPNSILADEAAKRFREARDRLGQSEYRVGLFYFRSRWYPGAIDRFRTLLKNDPQFTGRDAVYFYLAESLVRMNQQAEALPYYERLVDEFVQSEFLAEAQKRLEELKSAVSAKPSAVGAAPPP